jgi:putative pyruvate formate lyase activating enzyme
MTPSYIALHERGELAERAEKARVILEDCTLCPRQCRVNRFEGEEGHCLVGAEAEVASAGPHFGEEDPLVGSNGSGTIFMSSCNLRCTFCQNYDISQQERGQRVSARQLGQLMVDLQLRGCHNINFVTPTHQLPAILEGLIHAVEAGLSVPLVYNSSGYDSVESLELLDGIFDIYMPDLKTLSSEVAERYMNAPNYPDAVKAALREMHRQVGDLVLDSRGIAMRGILLRHLVMPAGKATTREAMTFLRDEISPDTYVNVMAQYRPAGRSSDFTEIDRPITGNEYQKALDIAAEVGMQRLDERRPKFFIRWG